MSTSIPTRIDWNWGKSGVKVRFSKPWDLGKTLGRASDYGMTELGAEYIADIEDTAGPGWKRRKRPADFWPIYTRRSRDSMMHFYDPKTKSVVVYNEISDDGADSYPIRIERSYPGNPRPLKRLFETRRSGYVTKLMETIEARLRKLGMR